MSTNNNGFSVSTTLFGPYGQDASLTNLQSASFGNSGSHTHSLSANAASNFSGSALDFAVQYVDLIIASKN